MVFITLLSLLSFSGMEGPEVGIPNMDKGVHFVFYAVAAFLGCLFLREISKRERSLNKTAVRIVVFLFIYGILLEVLQWKLTTWRSGEVADALANGLGALAGAVLVKLLFSRKWQLKWKN